MYTLYRSPHPHPQPSTEGQRIGTYPTILQALQTADHEGWYWVTPDGDGPYYRDAVETVPPPRPIWPAILTDLQAILGQ